MTGPITLRPARRDKARSIDIRIARIDRKVERDPAKPQIIKTVRCAGYLFARDKD